MKDDRLRLSDPHGKDPKGNSAFATGFEEQAAQRHVLAENTERIKQLERNIADLTKLAADQEALSKRANNAGSTTGQTRHVAHAQGWRAVCTQPDLCKVGDAVVAFDTVATLDNKQTASPNVKARGTAVYRQDDMFKTVQGNAGKGIESGTSLGTGHVKILDGQANVKVDGRPVARHDSCVRVNCDATGKGGAMGKLVTEQKSVKTSADKGISHPLAPPGKRTSERLENLKAERAEIVAGQWNFDALDTVFRFEDARKALGEQIARVSAETGTSAGNLSEIARGISGFGKDAVLNLGELVYESAKNIPKTARSKFMPNGNRLRQLEMEILAEEISLGNVTAGGVWQQTLDVGAAIVKPVTDPWNKGHHIEAITRGGLEVGTLLMGWIGAGKAARAKKVAEAINAAEAARAAEEAAAAAAAVKVAEAAEDTAIAAKARNVEEAGSAAGQLDDGVHVAGPAAVGEGQSGIGAAEKVLFENKFPLDKIADPQIVPPQALKNMSGNLNYVVLEDGKLVVGKSPHTSLTLNKPVLSAGEIQLFNGKIKWLDNASGHYQPTGLQIQGIAESAFGKLGMDATGKFQFKVWKTDPSLPRGGKWVKQ